MSTTVSMPRIAWIGLGNMGRAMTTNIVNKSNAFTAPLVLYNRTTARAEALSSSLPPGKTSVAYSIAEAIEQADIVFTIVSNDAAFEETVAKALQAPNGLKGKLLVGSSTIAPETAMKMGQMITEAGGEFLAMPVFGAAVAADAGKLLCVPAGPKSCVDKVRPFLDGVMGRMTIDLSDESYDKALKLKILGNSFLFGMVESLSEAHVVAEKAGLGTDNLHKFIMGFFGGTSYEHYSARMVSGDYHKNKEPAFEASLARKDAGLNMKLAKSVGARMANVETADARLVEVQKHATDTGIKGDFIHMYGIIRAEAGLPFEN
ncbi:hypothetical protein LTR85_009601 [Meristemomyces frigidus]|nr:hypothetical protein LTR85_009601 [Meristemomyces frigidus]